MCKFYELDIIRKLIASLNNAILNETFTCIVSRYYCLKLYWDYQQPSRVQGVKGLKSDSHLPKKKLFFAWMMKNAYFILKALLFPRYLSFCYDFGHVGNKNSLIRKIAKVNFKIHDITTWLTNNCNTHITQYFKKLREPHN